ncbi:MAG: hypothetical protein ABR915_10450 [Thermoguttaceae bacterium]|jgi:hypothetical protein
MHDEIAFLKTSEPNPLKLDEPRVMRCLVHRRNDVRQAAVDLLCKMGGKRYAEIVIRQLATHPSWKEQTYGVAKKLMPFIDSRQGNVLIECFDSLGFRDETAYHILCHRCDSQPLIDFLKGIIEADTSARRTHLATKALSCVPGVKTAFWRECLKHRHEKVRQCARTYLAQE